MDELERTRASKLLSRLLRHAPQSAGLTLQPGGWVAVETLILACRSQGIVLTRAQIADIVATSDKQRFALGDNGETIRANQGHSVPVDLGLVPLEPPAVLFHGTHPKVLDAILQEGLKRMQRHHVHLSQDLETARKVGSRRGRPVILRVDAARMWKAGCLFWKSANGVWLTDVVAPSYLSVTA